jgi:hypothetical protein
MIVMMGDDGAGFQGLWAQTGRFGGTFLSPKIQASSSSLAIVNANLTIAGNDTAGVFTTSINSTDAIKVVGVFSMFSRVNAEGIRAENPLQGTKMLLKAGSLTLDPISSGSGNFAAEGGSGIGSVLVSYGSNNILMRAQSGSTAITSGTSGAYIDFSGSNSYLKADQIRWNQVFNETIFLGGVTISKWAAVYGPTGTYLGKMPIIP